MRLLPRESRLRRSPAGVALLVFLLGAPAVALGGAAVFTSLAQQQRDTFKTHVLAETRSVLVAVPDDIRGEAARELGQALRRPQRLEVVLVDAAGLVTRSSSAIGLADVPPELRDGEGGPAAHRTAVSGDAFVVAGGSTGAGPDIYLFFSEAPLAREQNRIALAVTTCALAVLVLAVAGGWVHSHRRVRSLALRRAREQAFTAHLAHELRTPVGALVTASSLVDESSLRGAPEVVRAPVEVMQTQARRLRRIVEDLLELSRLETGQVELRLEPVDVARVAEETVVGGGWESVRVEAIGNTVAHVDRHSVARLLLNLVGNAMRHARVEVVVTVRGDDRQVELEVTDDGDGMDPDLVDMLTRPDEPDVKERLAAGSRGLGLLIVRAHAGLLRAALEAESGGGSGTTVRVRLPAAGADRPSDRKGADVVQGTEDAV